MFMFMFINNYNYLHFYLHLTQVFSKKDPKTNDKQKSQNAEKNIATDLFLAGKKGQKELQQLLLKAEKDDISE